MIADGWGNTQRSDEQTAISADDGRITRDIL
jgi:hypothetical protein